MRPGERYITVGTRWILGVKYGLMGYAVGSGVATALLFIAQYLVKCQTFYGEEKVRYLFHEICNIILYIYIL